jgi:phosphonate dehydrogenase
VDEGAVAEALDAGGLGGYAADVFEMEDWAVEGRRRDIPLALRRHPNTLFTPHLGSAVGRVRRLIDLEAAENVVDALVRGVRPRGAINTPVMQ